MSCNRYRFIQYVDPDCYFVVIFGIRINALLPLTAENHNKITIWINILDETVSVTRHSFDPILDIWFDEDMEKLEISHSEIEALLKFEDEFFRANFS